MARDAELKRGKAMFDSIRPAGSVAVIVAWHELSDCDPPADYFNVKRGPLHLLAWSNRIRDSFVEMRRAAESYERTYHLRVFDRGAEYRRKYAHGHGVGSFIKDADFYGTGWTIRKWAIGQWSMEPICLALARGCFHFGRQLKTMKAMIYEDPITRRKSEGIATILIEYGEADFNGNKTCTVLFDGDDPGMIVTRQVHTSEMQREES